MILRATAAAPFFATTGGASGTTSRFDDEPPGRMEPERHHLHLARETNRRLEVGPPARLAAAALVFSVFE
jgi:hypothetical protein